MDATYSTLAFIDAMHDFTTRIATTYLPQIQHGLPGTVLPLRRLIRGDVESFILDMFLARNFHTEPLLLDSPEEVYRILKQEHETFGLLGDANGSFE